MEVTTRQYYTCALCGRTSTNKEKIEECEQSHVKVASDTTIEMQFGRGPRRLYPEIISLVMEDGAVADYNLIGAKKVRE